MLRKLLLTALAVGVLSAPDLQAQAPDFDQVFRQPYISANQLVDWVLQRNAGVAERAAAHQVALHQIELAGSLDDPSLSYSIAPRTFGRAGQGLNQKIEFSQAIPWPGTLQTRQVAATHRARIAHESVRELRIELVASARIAFAELYFIQRALDVHHRTHALLDELTAVAQARYAAGKAARQDVLRAELEAAQLQRHLLELARIETSVKARINGLLNRAPMRPLPQAGPIDVIASVPSIEVLAGMALRAHPELQRLDAHIAATSAEVRLAEKAFYPDLQFIAGYNSLWDEADKRPVVGLSVTLPLDRRKRREALFGAQAERRRAELQRENGAARLLAEISQARAAVIEARDNVLLHEASIVPLARQFLDAALADYESGNGGFAAVITAEQNLLQAEETLERSHANAARGLAQLELTVGMPLDHALEEVNP